MKNQELINMLIYRSWHRGSKETDILLGDFAKSQIHTLNEEELAVYTTLIEENDWDIYEWILNEEITVPQEYASIITKIRTFNIAKIKNL
jgi:antitoxin CptB